MTLAQILGTGAGAVALLALSTFLLPRHVVVERTGKVSAKAADILSLAASNEGYQKFNPYISQDPNLKIEMFGPKSGVGSGFKFDGKDGKGTVTITATTDTSVQYSIDLGSMGQPTQRIDLAPSGDATQISWRMDADMGMNPIGRVMGLFLDRMVGPSFETGIKNLNTALSSN